jgi:branched-chain amino acid transport system substrate-binding protein
VRKIWIAMAFLAVAVVMTACGSSSNSSSGDTGGEEGPIVVGSATADTGFMAPFDQANTVGVELAVEDINKEGGIDGRQLKVSHINTKSDKAQSTIAGEELVKEGAALVTVSCALEFGGPAASVAQANERIAMGCASDSAWGPQGLGNNVFTLNPTTSDEGSSDAEWAYETQGWKNVFVLTDTSIEYLKSVSEGFVSRWKQLAGDSSIAGEDTFIATDQSIASQISDIRSLKTKPDFIFMPTCPPAVATAMKQLRAAGIDQPVMSGGCSAGDFWLGAVPDLKDFYAIEYVSTHGDDPNDEVNALVKRIEAKLGSGSSAEPIWGVVGYAEVEAWAEAAKKAGTIEATPVREELEKFDKVPLIIGDRTFTPEFHGDYTAPVTFVGVEDGAFHYVEKWTPKEPLKPEL